jgi:DNA-binding transcriptional ArsR family regulator
MTAQASFDVKAFDAVHHPQHYNSHPSGVECVEYSELLPGNLSHVCVYVWRHADKEKPVEDLRKALWFLERELARSTTEQEESLRHLGKMSSGSARARIEDRLRHLARFVKEKEFVALTVSQLCQYELGAARALITHHLKRLEKAPSRRREAHREADPAAVRLKARRR